MDQNCSDILQPLATSQQASPAVLPSLNYTNQDFSSLKTRITLFIEQRFPNDFSDFVESDLGIFLLEMWAFIADTLSFKMDQIANEIFIDTVTQIDNAFRLAQLVGFQPTPPIAASALFSATVNNVLQTDLIIPGALSVSVPTGGSTLTYELFPADALNNPQLDGDIVIPAGSYVNTSIIGLEGRTVVDIFTSTGLPNQILTLGSSPVLYDTIRVDVDGSRWTEVSYFTSSQPRKEYRVEFNSTWQAYVIFGSSAAGYIPSIGSQIQVTYRVGGGENGNVVSNSINYQAGFLVPGFNVTVPVTFVNYTKGQFGYNGDTIDDIRMELPAYNATQNRAVTGSDYETLAELYTSTSNGQIGKAVAVLRNYGCAANIVDLYVLAKNGANGLQTANDQLKTELFDYFEPLKMFTDYLCIRDGEVLLVDVSIDLTISNFYQKFSDEIQAQATQAVNIFFNVNNWDYGESLQDTDIVKILANITEVETITVSFTTNEPGQSDTLVTPTYYQVIRPDSINIVLNFD
jgi:hypothetical protein